MMYSIMQLSLQSKIALCITLLALITGGILVIIFRGVLADLSRKLAKRFHFIWLMDIIDDSFLVLVGILLFVGAGLITLFYLT